jgi:hypothetical protein
MWRFGSLVLKRAVTFVSVVSSSMAAVVGKSFWCAAVEAVACSKCDLELFSNEVSAGNRPVGVQRSPLARDEREPNVDLNYLKLDQPTLHELIS